MASYIRNQPVATDDLSVSAPILSGNTNKADDSFGIDHFQFSDLTTNNGFHKKVTLPGSLAAPTPAAGFGDMYAVTTASITKPIWRRDGLAGTPEFPMLPIKAFGSYSSTGVAIGTPSNIFSCTNVSTGRYDFVLSANVLDPAGAANYSIFAASNKAGSNPATILMGIPLTATTFQVFSRDHANVLTDSEFSVMVLQL